MKQARQYVLSFARKSGLLPILERARFLINAANTYSANKKYQTDNPSIRFPPVWWMHDMYAHTSYELYANSGLQHAKAIIKIVGQYFDQKNPIVLEWGCGMGRILQHLPSNWAISGFDYNKHAIDWCRDNLPFGSFHLNGLLPPLEAESETQDFVYAISVFTHLSEKAHVEWIKEIHRILKKGGVFIFSVHGAPEKGQLLEEEQALFDQGHLVVRGQVLEGSRIFTAYHPEKWVREFLGDGFEVLQGPEPQFGQTCWIVRKI